MKHVSSAEGDKTGRSALCYAGAALDRAHHLRDDPDGLARLLESESTRFVPVCSTRNLAVTGPGGPALARVPGAELSESSDPVFLGLDADDALFAVAVDEATGAQLADQTGARFEDLRRIGPALSGADAALAAYARGMIHWHRTHRYCPVCGGRTSSVRGGHERLCDNPDCRRRHFPRSDPAVIMLVEHPDDDGLGPRCLLGRSTRFPDGMYSTLAGFVEPGENLEEAVAREVREETGIEVESVEYLASQPWPFPASIMLGFRAVATTTAIRLDDDEIEDAAWFTPAQVAAAADEARPDTCLPRPDSIARFLIEEWRERHQ